MMTVRGAPLAATHLLLAAVVATSGCVPLPVSTVVLQPREARPMAVESAPSTQDGLFSSPAFDAGGALLAAYDSGSDQVMIFRVADLSTVDARKPLRRPRRLSFSPSGQFLVIEAWQGWLEGYLTAGSLPAAADLDSPAALRDNVQRVEVWNLRTGQAVQDLGCDAVITVEPKGGWLWARGKAITPGSRNSAIAATHFSSDEREFSMLCGNGVQHRWDTRRWEPLASTSPPPFWDALMGPVSDIYLTENGAASQSVDGQLLALRAREPHAGSATTYLWDRRRGAIRWPPGECKGANLPIQALSGDGGRLAVICNKGLGHGIRAWDMHAARQIPLQDAEFGLARGGPLIRSAAVAVSPDGRYLAAALLTLLEAMIVSPLPAPLSLSRSDLRLWSLEQGRALVAVPIDDLVSTADYFRGVDLAISPDSATLAVGGRRLRLYRLGDLASRQAGE